MTASSSPKSWPLPRNAAGQQAQHCTKAGVHETIKPVAQLRAHRLRFLGPSTHHCAIGEDTGLPCKQASQHPKQEDFTLHRLPKPH